MSYLNWATSPAQASALYFVEYVSNRDVDADLDQPAHPDWPPLLDRQQAAQYLGVGEKWLSDMSGNGPRGGKLPKVKIRGLVRWRLVDLQAYERDREQVRLEKQRGEGGRYG